MNAYFFYITKCKNPSIKKNLLFFFVSGKHYKLWGFLIYKLVENIFSKGCFNTITATILLLKFDNLYFIYKYYYSYKIIKSAWKHFLCVNAILIVINELKCLSQIPKNFDANKYQAPGIFF